jgi:nifR3 family TIM-barrel protein
MKFSWQKIEKPIIAMAPMADVTDVAFRCLFAKYGKPDVMWAEFVAADGLIKAPDKFLIDLKYSKKEKPIIAQLFSSNPENMEKACALVQKLGFDGIDINMGCPDRSIEKQGCGVAMIKTPEIAKEIIEAAKKGASKIPVSVKTRIGYYKIEELEKLISFLLKQDLDCLTVHFRTRKEMSKVDAHWELAEKVVKLRNKISPRTIILGNGDVFSLEDAHKKIKETGVDGVMIGRAVFGNPFFFSGKEVSVERKLKVMIEHAKLFEKLLPDKNFSIMKKHFKAYVGDFKGAKNLRIKLMKTNNSREVEKIVKDFLKINLLSAKPGEINNLN